MSRSFGRFCSASRIAACHFQGRSSKAAASSRHIHHHRGLLLQRRWRRQRAARNHETKSEAQSQPKPEPKPRNGTLAALVSCAKSSGYEVDRRDRNLIVISGSAGQGQMNVERMPTHAEAAAAAKAADLIESTVVGRLWLKYYSADESLSTDVDTCALTGTPD